MGYSHRTPLGRRGGGLDEDQAVAGDGQERAAREIFELQKLGGRYGRSIGMHFRNTPGDDTGETNGIQEMLANAAALGTPAIALHFNNPGYNMVHELLVRMRERGYNVWGEIYLNRSPKRNGRNPSMLPQSILVAGYRVHNPGKWRHQSIIRTHTDTGIEKTFEA